MAELAALIAQLTGQNQQPASDPALAAVKLARVSLDALVLKLGQTIEAKVVGQLAAGLTQLAAGTENFVLKLETPLPAGTPVTIRVTPTPQGQPSVTVSVPSTLPQPALPLQEPISAPALVEAQLPHPAPSAPQPASPPSASAQAAPPPQPAPQAPVSPAPLPQATQLPLPEPVNPARPPAAQPTQPPQVQPQVLATAPPASPPLQPAPATTAQPAPVATAPIPPPALATTGQPASMPPGAQPLTQSIPAAGTPAAQVPLPATAPAAAALQIPVAPPPPVAVASPAAPTATQPAPSLTPPLATQPPQPLPSHPSPYSVQLPQSATTPVAQQLPLVTATSPATPRPAAPPQNLADPAQAAARQDSAAPLLARLATIVTVAAPSLPRPVIEVAQRLLANRIDLNRGAPAAKTLEAAVLKAGVLLAPLTRAPAADSKSTLLALRGALLAFLGSDTAHPIAPAARPAPPIKGEAPRAPPPQLPLADPSADAHDTARALLGHTDAALSRLKLLQTASQPPGATSLDAPAPRHELRVEIPVLLGAETGILQLLVERDGKHRREPERQRGWRMRFAVNFSQTGEVGAEVALLGHAASIAIWAADPELADTLDAMLPDLAPAIQRHGLELTSLRVRRGAPQTARAAPGQLLDSAR
jgi:hypothetical protein